MTQNQKFLLAPKVNFYLLWGFMNLNPKPKQPHETPFATKEKGLHLDFDASQLEALELGRGRAWVLPPSSNSVY